MNEIVIAAAASAVKANLESARLGSRFGRLDLSSKLALLSVEKLAVDFSKFPPSRIGICLAAKMGSLSTDFDYWAGRGQAGGPSPTLFAYTLPSAAIGEIAIRHRLTGPNLCFIGDHQPVLREAAELIRQGAADAMICVSCSALSESAASLLGNSPAAKACAIWLLRGSSGLRVLGENDRDMDSLCDILAGQ